MARARSVAHQIAPELTTDVAVLPDPPVAALVDASADAELVVIGMIAGTGAEIVLGSVTLDVTTAAHCPVTVVRGETAMDHVAKGHRGRPAPVLLGIESVGADAAAVAVAFDDADRHGSGVVVMHVPAGHLGDSASAVRDQLAPWRSAHPDVEVTVRIGQGNPGVALLHESTAARHIVLGTRGRHAVVRAVLGSVSRFVLRHSLVPVTVVPRSLTTAEGSTVRQPSQATPTTAPSCGDRRDDRTCFTPGPVRGSEAGSARRRRADRPRLGPAVVRAEWTVGGRPTGRRGHDRLCRGRQRARAPR